MQEYLEKFKLPAKYTDKDPVMNNTQDLELYYIGIARGVNQVIDEIIVDLKKQEKKSDLRPVS